MTAEAERPLPCPLPCPFCGAKMVPQDGWELVGIELFVHSDAPSGDREPCIHSDTLLDLDEIAAWNRRAPDAQVRPIGNEALDERTKRVIAELEKLIKDLDLPEPALIAEMSELGYAARIMPLPDYGIMLIRRTVRRALDAELRVIAATARADEAERQRDEARAAAFEEAACEADAYAAVNIQMAGDTILHDPVLSGRDRSERGFAKSAEMQVDGTIHSAAYHAATNIAGRIRALSALPPPAGSETGAKS